MAEAEIGLVGLGTMGAALALNIAEKGHAIAVWNRTAATTRRFHAGAGALADRIVPTETLDDLVAAIRPPRAIILMVPAGAPVDQQIAALRPLLGPDDLIVDAGNANFHDTEPPGRRRRGRRPPLPRHRRLGRRGRRPPRPLDHGRRPAAPPGTGWRRFWTPSPPTTDGTPCATWMGEGGAGHFVKTVHNGIEYADMQMIAEAYGVMRDGLGMTPAAIAAVFARWNEGPLQSYLIEISADVAAATDPGTGRPMLDVILDRAGQKGTGRWTAIEAQHLAAPVPAIEAAVAARNLSALLEARRQGGGALRPARAAGARGPRARPASNRR